MTILERVKDRITAHLEDEVARIESTLSRLCQSPIEIALGLAIVLCDRIENGSIFSTVCIAGPNERWPEDSRLLIPQFPVGRKRIDFLFSDGLGKAVFIECDGHDFHERTRSQARSDRSRDRLLQKTYPVLRFTGSEIFADAMACADEIFEFVGDLHIPPNILREMRAAR